MLYANNAQPAQPAVPLHSDTVGQPLWLRCALAVMLCAPILDISVGQIAQPAQALPALEVSQATGRATLRVGSTGGEVTELQGLLSLLGYYENPISGIYGANTESAVRAFQQDAGLEEDGIVGLATWRKLLPTPSTELTPPVVTRTEAPEATSQAANEQPQAISLPTLKIGMFGPAVMQVQEALRGLGFYSGPIDGIFGPGTEAAVSSFQTARRLAADGVIGPATWQALLQ